MATDETVVKRVPASLAEQVERKARELSVALDRTVTPREVWDQIERVTDWTEIN